MKNTVLANFRSFPQEYTPLTDNGIPMDWNPCNRYFYFAPFHLQVMYVSSGYFGWKITLQNARSNNRGAYLKRTSYYQYPQEACFWLPSDRAVLRLLRMFEKYSTAEYLQRVCRPGVIADASWALEAEFDNMMRKVERFCHSYGCCSYEHRYIVPNVNTYNQLLYNG